MFWLNLLSAESYLIRGQKVIVDRDLGELYQVKPNALRQQVVPPNLSIVADLLRQLRKGLNPKRSVQKSCGESNVGAGQDVNIMCSFPLPL